MEEVGSLFDSCDRTSSGRVPVSKLILAVRNVVNTSDNDPKQREKDEMLMTIRFLLDPLEQDVQIDKGTWTAAWRRVAEYPSPQKRNGNSIRELAGGDDATLLDTSSEGQGSLDQSKHSYCFSPGSRTSSVEIEPEELMLLKEENQQLQSSLKNSKQQLQKLEDALTQEQTEKQDLEKIHNDEITRLTKQCKLFQEASEDLKVSLDSCEREKLGLCHALENQTVIEKQLRTEVSVQNKVIVALNMDIEESNQEKDRCALRVVDLQSQLERQANTHQLQVKEFQEAIQNCLAEKDELSSKITYSLLHRRDLSTRLEELKFPSLETELALQVFQTEGCNSDSSSINEASDDANVLTVMKTISASHHSTPHTLHPKSTELGSSLLEEMQAVGSFIHSDLNSSNDSIVENGETPNALPNGNSLVVGSNSVKHSSSFNTLGTESCLLDADHQNKPLEKNHQSVQTEIQVFDVETQTQGLSCNISIESPSKMQTEILASHIATQTDEERNVTFEEPLMKIDQSIQTEVQASHIATQTDEERNVTFEESLMKIDQSIQTEVQTCVAASQTMCLFSGSSAGPHIPSTSMNPCGRITQNTDTERPCSIDPSKKPLSLALRLLDDHHNFENQSSTGVLTTNPRYRLCFAVTCTGIIFLVLLTLSTILCTGAVLETASESGILVFPYYGSTPSWIKRLVKPIVGINPTKDYPV